MVFPLMNLLMLYQAIQNLEMKIELQMNLEMRPHPVLNPGQRIPGEKNPSVDKVPEPVDKVPEPVDKVPEPGRNCKQGRRMVAHHPHCKTTRHLMSGNRSYQLCPTNILHHPQQASWKTLHHHPQQAS